MFLLQKFDALAARSHLRCSHLRPALYFRCSDGSRQRCMSCLRSTVQCCLHCLVTDNFRSWAVEPREDASDRGYYRSLRDNDDGSDGSLEPDLVLDGASLTVEDRTFAEGGYCTGIYRGFFRSTAGTSESSTSSVSSRSGRVGVVRKDDDEGKTRSSR